MNRLTNKIDGKYSVEDTNRAVERLAVYENIQESLECEQKAITAQMAELRASGKEKTVKYRELFAKKLQNINALSLFQTQGL